MIGLEWIVKSRPSYKELRHRQISLNEEDKWNNYCIISKNNATSSQKHAKKVFLVKVELVSYLEEVGANQKDLVISIIVLC